MTNQINQKILDDATVMSIFLSNINVLNRIRHALRTEFFDSRLIHSLKIALNYYDNYGKILPSSLLELPEGMNITTRLNNLEEDYAVAEISKFCKLKAYTNVIYTAPELLEQGEYDKLDELYDTARFASDQKDDWGAVFGNMIGTIEPPVYLIDPFIIKGSVSGVYGQPGSFKSFFALDLALKLATGMFGLEKLPVCYIAAEGAKGINLRAEAWCQYHNKIINETDLLLITNPLVLTNNSQVVAFINYIRQIEKQKSIDYCLFVIDTLSQCMPGADENSAKDTSIATTNMIRMRRELDTTIIFVHHTGKDASKEMRGSSVIKANTDAMIEITRNGMDGMAHLKRQKDGPAGNKLPFDAISVHITRLADTELDSSLVCKWGDPAISLANTPVKMMANIHLLRQLVRHIGIGSEMSTRSAIIAMGKSDSTHNKKLIADLTPLDKDIIVDMIDGSKIGLRRTATTGYGDIRCWNTNL